MPSDERVSRIGERCSLHPASPAVARCDGCGRQLCLSCAVPVRGRVLGSECLAEALGTPLPALDEDAVGSGRAMRTTVGLAFAVATLVTVLPWSRFGEGSSMFGAWGLSPRWSVLAAVAAVAGFVLWFVTRRRPEWPATEAVLAVLGALVALGAMLAILRPPYATRLAVAPWIAVAAGLTALAASLFARRSRVHQPAGRA